MLSASSEDPPLQNPQPILRNVVIALAGNITEMPVTSLKRYIEAWGGSYAQDLDESVTHVLTTVQYYGKNGTWMSEAKECVGEDNIVTITWLMDSIHEGKKKPTTAYRVKLMHNDEYQKSRLFPNMKLFEIYQDSLGFDYDVPLQNPVTGMTFQLSLYQAKSPAEPRLYQVGSRLYTNTGPGNYFPLYFQTSQQPGSFQKEVGVFKTLFLVNTGVKWDDRLKLRGYVHDNPRFYMYNVPKEGEPVGWINLPDHSLADGKHYLAQHANMMPSPMPSARANAPAVQQPVQVKSDPDADDADIKDEVIVSGAGDKQDDNRRVKAYQFWASQQNGRMDKFFLHPNANSLSDGLPGMYGPNYLRFPNVANGYNNGPQGYWNAPNGYGYSSSPAYFPGADDFNYPPRRPAYANAPSGYNDAASLYSNAPASFASLTLNQRQRGQGTANAMSGAMHMQAMPSAPPRSANPAALFATPAKRAKGALDSPTRNAVAMTNSSTARSTRISTPAARGPIHFPFAAVSDPNQHPFKSPAKPKAEATTTLADGPVSNGQPASDNMDDVPEVPRLKALDEAQIFAAKDSYSDETKKGLIKEQFRFHPVTNQPVSRQQNTEVEDMDVDEAEGESDDGQDIASVNYNASLTAQEQSELSQRPVDPRFPHLRSMTDAEVIAIETREHEARRQSGLYVPLDWLQRDAGHSEELFTRLSRTGRTTTNQNPYSTEFFDDAADAVSDYHQQTDDSDGEYIE